MTRFYFFKVVATIVALSLVRAQEDVNYNNDYGDYAEYKDYNNDYPEDDSLYYDYAEREQQKK